METKIDQLWAELETAQNPTSGLLYRRYSASVRPDVFAGIRGQNRSRLLAIGLSEPATLPALALYDLRLETVTDPARPSQQLLLLVLTNPAQADLFSVVCEDLITCIANHTNQPDVLRALTDRLNQWQALFENARPEGLSAESRQGLFGELLFLQSWLAVSPDAGRCLTAWTGPTGSPHDYQPGSVAVEIKTTSAVNPHAIRISNEYQLDDTGLAGLFVCLFLLDTRPEGTAPFKTLNQLIDNILNQVSDQPAAQNQFRLRLYEAGYHPVQRALYDQPAYRVRETRNYRVVEGFPRLRASDLPPGINATQYNIGLTDCEPFRLTDDAILRELY